MLLGPVFAVELLTSGRRKRYFVLRVVYALILLASLWSSYESVTGFRRATSLAQNANVAAEFFQTFSIVQILAVLVAGPAMVAGTIAVERERRTIEYLLASDLSNGEIVLGKLAARLLQLVYVILVGLPVLAVAMLLGGIAPVELAMVFVVTASTMVCLSAVSIAVSVWSPRVRDAMGRIYMILLAVLLVPWLLLSPLMRWIGPYNLLATINKALVQVNPVYVLARMAFGRFGIGGAVPWEPVLTLVLYQTFLAVGLAAWATWAVRRVHLAQAGRGSVRRRGRRERPPRPIGAHPMLWKELFARQAGERLGVVGRIALLLLALAAIVPSIIMALTQPVTQWDGVQTVTMSAVVCCGGLLLVGLRAATAFTSEKERDTWTTLLSTPLGGEQIVWGKVLGVLYSVRWLLLILGFIWMVQGLRTPPFLVAAPFVLLVLCLLAVFATALGLRFSLTAKNSTRSLASTVGVLVALGGGYFLCCMPIMFAGPGRNTAVILAPCIPFLVSFPALTAVERSNPPDEIVIAFIMGLIGYVVACIAMLAHLVASFDRLAERMSENAAPPRRQRLNSPSQWVAGTPADDDNQSPPAGPSRA